MKIRTTIYLNPSLHRSLKHKALETRTSISNLIQDAVKVSMREEEIDLKTVRSRVSQIEVSYETVLKRLKRCGKI